MPEPHTSLENGWVSKASQNPFTWEASSPRSPRGGAIRLGPYSQHVALLLQVIVYLSAYLASARPNLSSTFLSNT